MLKPAIDTEATEDTAIALAASVKTDWSARAVNGPNAQATAAAKHTTVLFTTALQFVAISGDDVQKVLNNGHVDLARLPKLGRLETI
jgi:hypothetical protein